VLKHAQASQVSIVVERRDAALRVVVADDGTGFEPSTLGDAATGGRHMGLINMTERAALTGGELTIESVPGSGTTIFLSIPLPDEAQGDEAGAHA
jgi:signal transduction histidine kinase